MINIAIASGGLANLIMTVNNLPTDTTTRLRVVLNDRDSAVVLRDLTLLLMAFTAQDSLATAECAVHFWYSQFIPQWCLGAITSQIGPSLKDVPSFPGMNESFDTDHMYSKTWTFGSRSTLTTELTRLECSRLFILLFFTVPPFPPLTPIENASNLSLKRPWDGTGDNRDDWDAILARLPSKWRVARERYHQETIVWPFGQPRDSNWIMNP